MRRLHIPMILLLLALLLGACELPGGDDDDDDDDDRRSPLTQVEGNSGRGNADDADNPDEEGGDADADAADNPDEEGAAEPDRAAVARRLAGLNLSLPDGATFDSAPHFEAQDIQLRYVVAGMSPAQVLAFYRERLATAGYQIDEDDDDEIAFSRDGLSGEIEVDERDGRTQLEIDLDLE